MPAINNDVLNSEPFTLMQQKFAVSILFYLLEKTKSYQNELIRITGGSMATIIRALELLESFHYIKRIDRGLDHHPRWEFEITSRGRRIGHILKDAADQLLQVPP